MNRVSLWLAVAFFAGIGSGAAITALPAQADDVDDTYRKLRVLGQVLSYVQSNYVDGVKEDALVYDAIHGMLSGLDPHTVFMPANQFRKLREDTAGQFGGLGIGITEAPKSILITEVNADGPAERAGIQVGDKILAIDGEPVKEIAFSDAASLLRGMPGTKVVLTVERPSWKEPREIPLIRRNVRMQSVKHQLLDGGVGYIQIRSFQDRTDHDFSRALTEMNRDERKRGQKGMKGLIIDLRDNPGGLFDEGVKVADRFIKTGEIVRTEGRNPRNAEVEVAHPKGTEEDYPVVLLVNEGTASASEILAGALQDHRRAVVLGTRTYGKGSVQTLFGLDDGSGLKLTVARYYTPSGRSIQEVGIQPDVALEAGLADPKDAGTDDPFLRDIQLREGLKVIAHWPEYQRNLAKVPVVQPSQKR